MIPLTQNSLDRLQRLLKSFGYVVRYEKGSFRTGACTLLDSRIVVINKFSNLEVKVQALVDLIRTLPVDTSGLTDKECEFYQSIKQTALSI